MKTKTLCFSSSRSIQIDDVSFIFYFIKLLSRYGLFLVTLFRSVEASRKTTSIMPGCTGNRMMVIKARAQNVSSIRLKWWIDGEWWTKGTNMKIPILFKTFFFEILNLRFSKTFSKHTWIHRAKATTWVHSDEWTKCHDFASWLHVYWWLFKCNSGNSDPILH